MREFFLIFRTYIHAKQQNAQLVVSQSIAAAMACIARRFAGDQARSLSKHETHWPGFDRTTACTLSSVSSFAVLPQLAFRSM
jgi:hypothetical protein